MRRLATLMVAHSIAWFAAVYAYVTHPLQVRRFRQKFKRWPRPGMPRRYADFFFWRKVFDRDPRFIRISDKLGVKEYVRERMGDAIGTARVLWVGTRPEDIPDDCLKGNVVVKPNHSWNVHMYVRDGVVDRAALNATARGWMSREHHLMNAQWAYGRIERKVLVEVMLLDHNNTLPIDLKFWIFNGRALLASIVTERPTGAKSSMFDREGNPYGDIAQFPPPTIPVKLPVVFAKARELAEALCHDFDFIRCDFYVMSDTEVLLGELTVYPHAGLREFRSEPVMAMVDAAWDLRASWFLKRPRRGLAGLYAWAIDVIVSQTAPAGAAAYQTATAGRRSS